MPKLVLRPDISQFNRAQLEAHITAKRLRRMRAAIIYTQGKQSKLQHDSDIVAAKWRKQWDRIGRAIDKFNEAEEKLLNELIRVSELEHGYEMVGDLIADIEKDLADDVQ